MMRVAAASARNPKRVSQRVTLCTPGPGDDSLPRAPCRLHPLITFGHHGAAVRDDTYAVHKALTFQEIDLLKRCFALNQLGSGWILADVPLPSDLRGNDIDRAARVLDSGGEEYERHSGSSAKGAGCRRRNLRQVVHCDVIYLGIACSKCGVIFFAVVLCGSRPCDGNSTVPRATPSSAASPARMADALLKRAHRSRRGSDAVMDLLGQRHLRRSIEFQLQLGHAPIVYERVHRARRIRCNKESQWTVRPPVSCDLRLRFIW
jgi:hypothetical protein